MTVVVTVLLAVLFFATAVGKLVGLPASLAIRDHLQIPVVRWKQIGVLEVAGAAGVLLGLALHPLGVAAAAGLVLLSIGAIATHVRAGDKAVAALPALVALALAAATVVLQAV
jgi:DoxX-like family